MQTTVDDIGSGVFAVILAAGESNRMGVPKALLPIGKVTALERCVRLFMAIGISDIRIVSGACTPTVFKSRLPQLPVTWIHNDAYLQGMFSSICKGVSTPGDKASAFFLLPVDIPLVRLRTVSHLLESWRSRATDISVIHPIFKGERGHPPLISTEIVPEILSWKGGHGLKGFLDSAASTTMEVPVIDEFILRDMDRPEDYDAFIGELPKYDIPTPDECEAMLNDRSLFLPGTAEHCRLVSELAAFFSNKLVDTGQMTLDIQRITAAAMLHDIAKGKPRHAAAGARFLNRLGFSGISQIVSSHVDIHVSGSNFPTESEVVYLSDKLVKGSSLVTLSDRFGNKLSRYRNNPYVLAAIRKRMSDARVIACKIETATGTSIELIVNEFSRRSSR